MKMGFFVLVSIALLGCGSSLFSSFGKNESEESLKTDAILALNKSDFETATTKMEKLWNLGPTNQKAQLYAISLVGLAGFDLFCIIKQAVASLQKSPLTEGDSCKKDATPSATATPTSSDSSSGTQILSILSQFVGTSITDENEARLKKAIEILSLAPDAKDAGIVFQKCLTGGIYSVPTLSELTTSISSIQSTLQSLPTKLGAASGSTTCNASTTVVDEAGAELTSLLTNVANVSKAVEILSNVLGECLPADSKESVNAVTAQVNKIVAAADKGCSIPSTQQLGNYTLPSCMNSFVTSSSTTAVASDGIIAGCELFINCAGGSCL